MWISFHIAYKKLHREIYSHNVLYDNKIFLYICVSTFLKSYILRCTSRYTRYTSQTTIFSSYFRENRVCNAGVYAQWTNWRGGKDCFNDFCDFLQFQTSRRYQLKYNVMGDKIIPCIGLSDMGGMQSLWIIRRERRSTHKKITIR